MAVPPVAVAPGGGPPGVQQNNPPASSVPQAGAPAPQQEVLGQQEAGEQPAQQEVNSQPRQLPEAAPGPGPAASELPFTGQDLLFVTLLGVLSLAIGLGLGRVLSSKRFQT